MLERRTPTIRKSEARQLASALTWQDAVGQEIVLATFDRQLWDAAPPGAWRMASDVAELTVRHRRA